MYIYKTRYGGFDSQDSYLTENYLSIDGLYDLIGEEVTSVVNQELETSFPGISIETKNLVLNGGEQKAHFYKKDSSDRIMRIKSDEKTLEDYIRFQKHYIHECHYGLFEYRTFYQMLKIENPIYLAIEHFYALHKYIPVTCHILFSSENQFEIEQFIKESKAHQQIGHPASQIKMRIIDKSKLSEDFYVLNFKAIEMAKTNGIDFFHETFRPQVLNHLEELEKYEQNI